MNQFLGDFSSDAQAFIRKLPTQTQEHLKLQLNQIDKATLKQQKECLQEKQQTLKNIKPLKNYSTCENAAHQQRGIQALTQGEVGCLIVAGGEGTRLGYAGPKGMFPISAIKHKSLFQLFAEKTVSAGAKINQTLPLAIMTSPLNHEITRNFFKEHSNFGLSSTQLRFFPQTVLPFLNVEGNLFLSNSDSLAQGPDGNGGALHEFYKSGIWEDWLAKGVKYLNLILVDNPLADPFDAELIGCSIANKADVVIKSTLRIDEKERVGVIALENELPIVVEYTEMPESTYTERTANGDLSYSCANIGLFCLSMNFVKKVATSAKTPLHKALKETQMIDAKGDAIKANAWKFERFIFDMLPLSESTHVVVYPRESCFAPLKNKEGRDSPETVRKALEQRDRTILKSIFHANFPVGPIEIDQALYYPTEAMIKAPLVNQNGYITAR